MNPKTYFRVLTLLLTAFLFVSPIQNYGQEKNTGEFTVKSESYLDNGKTMFKVVVDINQEIAAKVYSVYIYDKEPWKSGEVIEKKEKTTERVITFSNIKEGKYCFYLVDEAGNMAGKWIEIKQ